MNFVKRNFIYLLALLTLSLGSFGVRADAFVISAEGLADTAKEARLAAAAELGKSILSKVESKLTSEVSVSGDQVTRGGSSKKDISSSLELKSIQYSNEQMVSGGFSVTAGLTQQGVDDNIIFMRKQLESDLDLLNREQLRGALTTLDHLNAFMGAVPKWSLSAHGGLVDWLKDRREQLLKRLNQGKVIFVSDIAGYSVKINGKEVNPAGEYYEVGRYDYTASAENYRNVNGTFSVGRGEVLRVKVPFIKALDNKQMQLSLPENYGFLKDELDDILEDVGVTLVPSADHAITFRISEQKREVDDFEMHRLTVRIAATRQGKKFKSLTVRKKINVEKGDTAKLQNTLRKMTTKGLVALLSRMELDEFFAK